MPSAEQRANTPPVEIASSSGWACTAIRVSGRSGMCSQGSAARPARIPVLLSDLAVRLSERCGAQSGAALPPLVWRSRIDIGEGRRAVSSTCTRTSSAPGARVPSTERADRSGLGQRPRDEGPTLTTVSRGQRLGRPRNSTDRDSGRRHHRIVGGHDDRPPSPGRTRAYGAPGRLTTGSNALPRRPSYHAGRNAIVEESHAYVLFAPVPWWKMTCFVVSTGDAPVAAQPAASDSYAYSLPVFGVVFVERAE